MWEGSPKKRWWFQCVAKETAKEAELNLIFIVRDVKRKDDACPPCDEMFCGRLISCDLSVGMGVMK